MLVVICLFNGLAGDGASSKGDFFPRTGVQGCRTVLLYVTNIALLALQFREHI